MAKRNNTNENSNYWKQPDPNTLTIEWLEHDDTICRFDQIEEWARWRAENGEFILEILTERPIDPDLLFALAPLLDGDQEEFYVNGVAMLPQLLVSGGFIPLPRFASDVDANVVHSAYASWLPGGPCEFNQSETIWELDGFHWVEASGDMEDLVIAIGDLGSPEASVAAAVRASHWFSFDEDGTVVSELEDMADPDEDELDDDDDDDDDDDGTGTGTGTGTGSGSGSEPTIRWKRPMVPTGRLSMTATFNIADARAFADQVERLVPERSGIVRHDPHGPQDRFEAPDGHVWRADEPTAMLVMAFACMPVEGTEFEGWSPRMRAEPVAGWPTVYEIGLSVENFVLGDPALRARWQPVPSYEPWQPPSLMQRVALLRSMGAGLLKFDVRSLVTP
jgi:hypothetical protein